MAVVAAAGSRACSVAYQDEVARKIRGRSGRRHLREADGHLRVAMDYGLADCKSRGGHDIAKQAKAFWRDGGAEKSAGAAIQ